jgi:diguanylate cyclase
MPRFAVTGKQRHREDDMVSRFKNSNLRIVSPPTAGHTRKGAHRVMLPPGARDYYRRIEAYAQRIRSTHDVPEIIGILDEALRETQGLAANNDLKLAISRVVQAEREIADLKAELQEAHTQVQVDQLTQVLNRRGLDESFARESARSDRHGAPLCVVMIDVDNFKSVNDRYGHQAGDAALVHIASTLRRTLRPVDVVARYGGEEFAVLLPDSDEHAALAAISRVQRVLRTTLPQSGLPMRGLTFSAGIARRERGEFQAETISHADAALLDAKEAGKNRVFLAGHQIAVSA